jgi:hypothetical protein
VVVENTDTVHNVIVCTLCSCYPRWLLGLPPDWYKSRNYRSRVINEPRHVLQEFGTVVPADMTVRVHDSTADMRYLVLPKRPAGTDGWPEKPATRDRSASRARITGDLPHRSCSAVKFFHASTGITVSQQQAVAAPFPPPACRTSPRACKIG